MITVLFSFFLHGFFFRQFSCRFTPVPDSVLHSALISGEKITTLDSRQQVVKSVKPNQTVFAAAAYLFYVIGVKTFMCKYMPASMSVFKKIKRLFGTNGISFDSQFSFLSQQIIILSAP